jgi:hypothetical protein
MTPENRGYHVDAGEASVLARSASVASRLRLSTANLSIAPELFARGGCLGWAALLCFRGRRVRHIRSGIASIGYAGLKQLDNCCLIRAKQFIRPLQTLKTLGQRLDLLIMEL